MTSDMNKIDYGEPLDVKRERESMQRMFAAQMAGLGYGPDGMQMPKALTMNDYQTLAQRTSRKDISPDDHLMNGMLGLSGEVGECSDLVKKCFYQDGRDIRAALQEELGDVLWYVAEVVSAMGWTLEDVARGNIDKLRRRYPAGFEREKSLNREE